MSYEVGQELDLTIERLSMNGGRGVARHDGFVFFVPFVMPEEVVRAKVSKVKKSYAEANLVEVLKAHPHRQSGACPLFGQCGGCTWQHIPYELQLTYKRQLLDEAFSSILDPELISPLVPSPRTFYYRNRIQLHRQDQNWGFKKRGSDTVIPIESCPITDARINLEIPRVTKLVPANEERIEIYVDPSNQVDRRFGKQTKYSGQFSQVNSEMNKVLNETVYRIVDGRRPKRLFDLYCGQGNFVLYLADTFSQCEFVGVELSEKNLEFAREGAQGSENVEFVAGDVTAYLEKIKTFDADDLVIVDPPRVGLSPEALNALVQSNPQQLIYISCDPMTLRRDLEPLLKLGLKIKMFQPLDMFPQTDHIETLVYLSV